VSNAMEVVAPNVGGTSDGRSRGCHRLGRCHHGEGATGGGFNAVEMPMPTGVHLVAGGDAGGDGPEMRRHHSSHGGGAKTVLPLQVTSPQFLLCECSKLNQLFDSMKFLIINIV
jgi:hypothetical protein